MYFFNLYKNYERVDFILVDSPVARPVFPVGISNSGNVGGCTKNDFRCNDGKCIRMEWKCDGSGDCSDGEDEKDCRSSFYN